MQTRKRAKSVIFGKKEKDELKEPVEKTKEVESKPSEKAETVERRAVPDKRHSEELSSTLPHSDVESSESEVATPHDEFVEDKESPTIDEPEVKDEEHEESVAEEPVVAPNPIHEVSQDAETAETEEAHKPESAPTPSDHTLSQPEESQELSSTLPPSAFTIQSSEAEITSKPEPEKKKFGVYFFVVAFLSFILGLGAMAAVSYFGLINLSLPKFSIPSSVPSILGSKPTPTSPPTVAPSPTAQPVDLSAYTIAILNGSGVTGEASKYKTSLTSDGFKVGTTGNADNNNFTKTEISAKKSVSQAYIAKLQGELQKTLGVDSSVTVSPDSDSTDVTVTLGSNTSQ